MPAGCVCLQGTHSLTHPHTPASLQTLRRQLAEASSGPSAATEQVVVQLQEEVPGGAPAGAQLAIHVLPAQLAGSAKAAAATARSHANSVAEKLPDVSHLVTTLALTCCVSVCRADTCAR